MFITDKKIEPIPFSYLPAGLDICSWDSVQEFLESICASDTSTAKALEELVLKYSDLMKAMADELSWRYIKMSIDADDSSKADAYNEYFADVYAPTEAYQFRIKKLYYDSPAKDKLDKQKYALLDQIFAKDIKLFREENIALQIQESELANKYGGIVSQMSAHFDGEDKIHYH